MNDLVDWTALRRELEQARSVVDLKTIHDKAKAIEMYMRDRDESLESYNAIAEHRIRVERKLGKLLAETVKRGGDRKSKSPNGILINGGLPKGVSPNQSSKWQKLSRIPEKIFEKAVVEAKDEKKELSTADIMRACTIRAEPQERPEGEDEIEDELDDDIEPNNARTAFMLRADQVRTFARDCAKLAKMFKMDRDALEVVRYALLDWKNLSKLLREQSCKRNQGSRRSTHSVSRSCRAPEK